MTSLSGSITKVHPGCLTRGDRTIITFVFFEEGGQFAGRGSGFQSATPAFLEESIDGGVQSFMFVEVALGFLESIGERSRITRVG